MLRSIPPTTALGRRSNIPERKFRFVGSGLGSGRSRISNISSYDKWTVAEHKPAVIKRKPKIIIRSEQGKINIEIHDTDSYYQIIAIGGKPSGIGIENLIRSLSPFGIQRETLNNGVWQAIIGK